MTIVRRPKNGRAASVPASVWIFILLFVAVVFLALLSSEAHKNNNGNNETKTDGFSSSSLSLGQQLRRVVQSKRLELQEALQGLVDDGNLPQRLKALRDKHEIIGERLIDIAQGKETAEEILHGHKHQQAMAIQHQHEQPILKIRDKNAPENKDLPDIPSFSDKPPMELQQVIDYLNSYLHQLHETLQHYKHATFDVVWQAYRDLTVKTLYPWDQEYLQRMPPRRNDSSIFLSVASYRDENCFKTLYQAYAEAKYPQKLFVGLVQQNCHENCRSGVFANGSDAAAPPDPNCYQLFCDSDLGQKHCPQVRLLDVDEAESLGPYAARYFGSKLWYGESWYMQVDSHMTFAPHWDELTILQLTKAPSKRPVLSHYPPNYQVDFRTRVGQPSGRICGPIFAEEELESQIMRLEGSKVWDKKHLLTPPFAPFTAAGYFASHSRMLYEVPFDPFLPWIFMGEEIIMSSRLWTSGYDIFSPTRSVVGHWYGRKHVPKFWESIGRALTPGMHNNLQLLVMDRIKYQLGYPEAALDVLPYRSILTAVESYTMGGKRSLKRYLKLVGLNMTNKQITFTEWCEYGYPPPGFEKYDNLYPLGVARRSANYLTPYQDDDVWELAKWQDEEEPEKDSDNKNNNAAAAAAAAGQSQDGESHF